MGELTARQEEYVDWLDKWSSDPVLSQPEQTPLSFLQEGLVLGERAASKRHMPIGIRKRFITWRLNEPFETWADLVAVISVIIQIDIEDGRHLKE